MPLQTWPGPSRGGLAGRLGRHSTAPISAAGNGFPPEAGGIGSFRHGAAGDKFGGFRIGGARSPGGDESGQLADALEVVILPLQVLQPLTKP